MSKVSVIMLLLFICVVMPVFAQSKASGAHLSLDSCYLNLGKVPRDSIAEGEMHFRNTGNAPLQILRIFSECGCTVPSYSSDEVMPGDTGVIRIRFNGKNRDAGSFRKALRIRSNADNSREVLIVKGRIE